MAAGCQVIRGTGPRRRVVPSASIVFELVDFELKTGIWFRLLSVRHFTAALRPGN
jgi:hypothetical protein